MNDYESVKDLLHRGITRYAMEELNLPGGQSLIGHYTTVDSAHRLSEYCFHYFNNNVKRHKQIAFLLGIARFAGVSNESVENKAALIVASVCLVMDQIDREYSSAFWNTSRSSSLYCALSDLFGSNRSPKQLENLYSILQVFINDIYKCPEKYSVSKVQVTYQMVTSPSDPKHYEWRINPAIKYLSDYLAAKLQDYTPIPTLPMAFKN